MPSEEKEKRSNWKEKRRGLINRKLMQDTVYKRENRRHNIRETGCELRN